NYKPWYAIAEFVDNALQSYVENRSRIIGSAGQAKVTIRVDVDGDRITIEDNAAGIAISDFPRAFLPAAPPPRRSGLSEFGLGTKAAACWFSRRWRVVTKAFDEVVERTVHFDVPRIVAENIESLAFEETTAPLAAHYTRVVLEDLNVRPQGRTLTKM